MPILTVETYLQGQLDGLVLPLGMASLLAYVLPPISDDDGSGAVAYVWGGAGDETRKHSAGSVPRARHNDLSTGGNKTLTHRVSVWLTYFGDRESETIGWEFPAILDAVMARLRNVEMLDATQHAHDP